MRSLLIAACVAAAAGSARATIDTSQCAQETMQLYNSSAM